MRLSIAADCDWLTLGELSSVISKGTTPKAYGIGVPFLRAEDINGGAVELAHVAYNIDQTTHQAQSRSMLLPGDLLITIAGTLGRVGYVPETAQESNCNQAVAFVRLDSKRIDYRFACYMLQADKVITPLLDLKKVGTIGNLNLEQIGGLRIPVPSLTEQNEIVAVLESCSKISRLWRVGRQNTEDLIVSNYLEFVFSAVSKSWPMTTIEDLSTSMRTGPFGSQLLHSEFTDSGIAVLGIDNAVNNFFSWKERRFISEEKYVSLKRYTVFPGDLIITIMGTCGRCAIVPDDIPTAINTKHLCCITLDSKKMLPEFLHATLLNHPGVLRELGAAQRGAIMDGLNMGIIKDTHVPVPPISLQNQFRESTKTLNSLHKYYCEGEKQAEQLFNSVLAGFLNCDKSNLMSLTA